jgi:FlaA1/EpsC-like NDP-sugar epimerase
MSKILSLSRFKKQLIIMLFDSIIIIFALISSFSLRLGEIYWPNDILIWFVFLPPVIAIPIFKIFGMYRTVIRFIGFKGLWSIMQAASIYALIWGVVGLMSGIEGIPRSVILINWFLVIILLIWLRMVGRWAINSINHNNDINLKNVVIFGAGSAGRQLSIALSESEEYNLIAFIDDNSDIHRHTINGLTVYPRKGLYELITNFKVDEVLLAIPSVSRFERQGIINFLEPFPVLVRSLPGVSELAQGKVKINDLLEIDINDLLGRPSVEAIGKLLKVNIEKKNVLVTGAGGSIGAELCRQIFFLRPKQLILFEISEYSLYSIEQELLNFKGVDLKIIPILGNINDELKFEKVCKKYHIDTIYHAAAYKHVTLVEHNPSIAVTNNIFSTLSIARAAISSNVKTFVLVSTDKAVRPSSIMGATKRLAELTLQALSDHNHKTTFTMVRFGNVLNSSGSVIPLFKKQIGSGGPLTVTHVDVVRYFMTIPEAVELVIQAGAMAHGGDVFVLDMGSPIRIDDLAKKMVRLSGLQVKDKGNPNGDIEINYTGLKPGEKLYEELLVGENVSSTDHKLIMRAQEDFIEWDALKLILDSLKLASDSSDSEEVIKLLKDTLEEFNPVFKQNSFDIN